MGKMKVIGGERLSLYDELSLGDILSPITRQLREGRLILGIDGRITDKARIDSERPWITAVEEKERNCSKWLTIYFSIYRIIPLGCRNCWKVAFHPKTLADAFETLEIQREMGISSKTGLEKRRQTGAEGGYSSFWYVPLGGGLSKGRGIFEEVEKILEERLGYSDGLILKRGCTEIEHFFFNILGNSQNWDKRADAFNATERLLDSVFDIPKEYLGLAPKICENRIKKDWIEWAFEHGDETYLKYTGGRSLVPPLFNYAKKENLMTWIPNTWKGESNDEGVDPAAAIESIV